MNSIPQVNKNINQQVNKSKPVVYPIKNPFAKYVFILGISYFAIMIANSIKPIDSTTIYSLIGTLIGSCIGAMIAIDGSIYVLNKTNNKANAKEVRKNAVVISTELYSCLDNIKMIYINLIRDKSNINYNIFVNDNWAESLTELTPTIGKDNYWNIIYLYQEIYILKNKLGTNKFEETLVWFVKKIFDESLINFNKETVNKHLIIDTDLKNIYRELFEKLYNSANIAYRIEKFS